MTRTQECSAMIVQSGLPFADCFGPKSDSGFRAFLVGNGGYVRHDEFAALSYKFLVAPVVDLDADQDRADRAAKYLGLA